MSARKGMKLKKAAVMKTGTAVELTTQELYRELLSRLVEDATRDGLAETPERVEKAMAFLTQGYAMDVRTVLNGALFEVEYDEMVMVQGVGVIVEAQHLCMMMRGVEKQHSATVTSAMRGVFKTQTQTRNEFLSLVRRNDGVL